MAVNPFPLGAKIQLETAAGTPAVGGLLFFYISGSSTKATTYTDYTGGSANPNPIVLNSLGMPTNEIWLTSGVTYKCVYAPAGDTDPPSSPIFTINGLTGINDVTAAVTEWIAGPTPTYIGATSFSLVGDQTGTFQVGRRVKTTNTAGTVYSTITVSAFAAVTTVTVVNDSGTLDSGLSAVSYGLLSATNNSLPAATIHGPQTITGAVTLQSTLAVTGQAAFATATSGFNVGSVGGVQRIQYGGTTFSFLTPADGDASIHVLNGTLTGTLAVTAASTLTGGVASLGAAQSFTGTLTGVNAVVTGTVYYRKIGDVVVMDVPNLIGTSNSTSTTITGMAAGIIPATGGKLCAVRVSDNGGSYATSFCSISNTGVITIFANPAGTNWTASGVKDIASFSIAYTLN